MFSVCAEKCACVARFSFVLLLFLPGCSSSSGGGSGAMNFTDLWVTRDMEVSVDGADPGECQEGSFEILQTETELEIADRIHVCGSTDATHKQLALVLDNGVIEYGDTEIGRVGPDSLEYELCQGDSCVSLSISRATGENLFDYHETFSGQGTEVISTGQLQRTGARLVALDGEIVNIAGGSPFGTPAEASILLKNEGTALATSLGGAVSDGRFAFKGGSFPGTGGSCTASLEPDGECSVVLAFQPVDFNRADGELTVSYENLIGPAELIFRLYGSADPAVEIPGTAENQNFGVRVAGSGVSVAAVANDGLYLMRKTSDGWTQPHLLKPGTITGVDLEQDQLIVGHGDASEAVDIYRYDGSGWSLENTLTDSDSPAGFGSDVAISGDLALVGMPAIGAVNAYRFDGGSWQFVERLTGDAAGGFGSGLALSGTTSLVASPDENDGNGSVTVYEFDGGAWNLLQTLSPGAETVETHLEAFGLGLDLDGDWAVVSAYEFARGTRAYVFRREAGNWNHAQVIGSGFTDWADEERVAVEGNWIVHAKRYNYEADGFTFVNRLQDDGTWQMVMQLQTGFAVDVAESFLVTGEPFERPDGAGRDAGMVRIFE